MRWDWLNGCRPAHVFPHGESERFLYRGFFHIGIALVATASCRSQLERQPSEAPSEARSPQRIVSLSPALTELVFALGAGERLVGRTRWGQDPPAAFDVPSVGDGLDPNIEVIVGRQPDLVLFYRSPSNSAAVDRINALGIATMTVPLDGLDELEATTRDIGEVLGRMQTADSLIADLHRRLVAETVTPRQRPSVLMLAWDNPPIVIGASSFLSEIVDRAGGRNVFADQDRPSLTVSIEVIAARDPDVVLIVGFETPAFADQSEWQTVPAVKARRFALVDGTEFAHPSFRAPNAIRKLREALQSLEQ